MPYISNDILIGFLKKYNVHKLTYCAISNKTFKNL